MKTQALFGLFLSIAITSAPGCKNAADTTSSGVLNPEPSATPSQIASTPPSPENTPSPSPSPSPSPVSLVPTLAMISVDNGDLVSVISLDNQNLSPADASGSFTTDTSSPASVSANPGAAAGSPSTTANVDAISSDPAQFRNLRDATAPWSDRIGLTVQFPEAATPACSLLAPYSSVSLSCAPDQHGFTITSADLTGADLVLKAFAQNGGASDFLNSNTLKTMVLYKQVVSDTIFGDFPQLVATSTHLYLNTKERGYRVNGSTLEQVTDYAGGTPNNDQIRFLTSGSDDTVYFFRNQYPAKLYSLSGSTIKQIGADGTGTGSISLPGYDYKLASTWMNGKLYYLGRANYNGTPAGLKLLRYDPVANTIDQLSDLRGFANDDLTVGAPLVVYNNAVYFSGNIAVGKNKLFRYSVANGLEQVTNFMSAGADFIYPMGVIDNKLYLGASTSAQHVNVFSYDGSVFVQRTDLPSSLYNGITDAIIYNNRIYFGLYMGGLFAFDPIQNTVETVLNATSSTQSNSLHPFAVYGDKIYYYDNTDTYVYNASKNLIAKIFTGRVVSSKVFGDHLYLTFPNTYLYRVCDPEVRSCT